MAADWQQWQLGTYHPADCGGHCFMYHPVQLSDLKRKSEKAYLATGQFQVLHHHPSGSTCSDDCEAFGEDSEVPRRG